MVKIWTFILLAFILIARPNTLSATQASREYSSDLTSGIIFSKDSFVKVIEETVSVKMRDLYNANVVTKYVLQNTSNQAIDDFHIMFRTSHYSDENLEVDNGNQILKVNGEENDLINRYYISDLIYSKGCVDHETTSETQNLTYESLLYQTFYKNQSILSDDFYYMYELSFLTSNTHSITNIDKPIILLAGENPYVENGTFIVSSNSNNRLFFLTAQNDLSITHLSNEEREYKLEEVGDINKFMADFDLRTDDETRFAWYAAINKALKRHNSLADNESEILVINLANNYPRVFEQMIYASEAFISMGPNETIEVELSYNYRLGLEEHYFTFKGHYLSFNYLSTPEDLWLEAPSISFEYEISHEITEIIESNVKLLEKNNVYYIENSNAKNIHLVVGTGSSRFSCSR